MMTSIPSNMQAGLGYGQVAARVRHLEQMITKVHQGQVVVPSTSTGGAEKTNVTSFASQLQQVQGTRSPQPASGKAAFQETIAQLSQQHGVDKDLVNALIQQESGFNPTATSSAGAQGLMQLMPATAKGLGVQNPLNPVENLDGGIRYLKAKLNQYHGNIPLALAAYNAGSGAVAKYNGIPPYKETQQYVKRVLANYLSAKSA